MAVRYFTVLVEAVVGGQYVGTEFAKNIAVDFIGARLGDQADDACTAALIRGRRILGFDANFLHAIFGNFHGGNNGGGVVF